MSSKTKSKVEIGSEEEYDRLADPARVMLIEIEGMHRSDVITLSRQVESANMRIGAACNDLRASQYATFEPHVTLSRYQEIEREIAKGKALLMRDAS